jgi:hypothetical protein
MQLAHHDLVDHEGSEHCPPRLFLPMFGKSNFDEFSLYPCTLNWWDNYDAPFDFVLLINHARATANIGSPQGNNVRLKA